MPEKAFSNEPTVQVRVHDLEDMAEKVHTAYHDRKTSWQHCYKGCCQDIINILATGRIK